jgi:hypothetical protein
MNRILIGCGMVLTIALAAVLVGFGPDKGLRTDREIGDMISRIDASQIQNTVNTLANTFTHQSCSDSPAPGQGVTDLLLPFFLISQQTSGFLGGWPAHRQLPQQHRQRLEPLGEIDTA